MKASKLPAHYEDLDAPIHVWNKVHSTGDYSWLLVKRKKLNDSLREQLRKVWENIYEQYFNRFGKSEEFVSITKKEIEIRLLKCELLITKDRVLETWIEIAEQELKEMKKVNSKGSFQQSKQAIESKFHSFIDPHKMSIEDFYSHLESLKKK